MDKTATMIQKSLMIFRSQLVKEMEWWKQSDAEPKPGHLLLQYMDGILIATEEIDLYQGNSRPLKLSWTKWVQSVYLTKDFQLFVHERQHLSLGVLTQKIGSWKRPVGYFSKQLDAVSKGWPTCLQKVSTTVRLIQEAGKLTLGRK